MTTTPVDLSKLDCILPSFRLLGGGSIRDSPVSYEDLTKEEMHRQQSYQPKAGDNEYVDDTFRCSFPNFLDWLLDDLLDDST